MAAGTRIAGEAACYTCSYRGEDMGNAVEWAVINWRTEESESSQGLDTLLGGI